MVTRRLCALSAMGIVAWTASVAGASMVTGSPASDGWTSMGHSLASGIYTRGNANYGYNIYSAALTVNAGSNLEIADGSFSWLVGDTVLGVGGSFADITAAAAGWGAFSGNSVNSQMGQANGPKLIAKFGTADATWSASGIAPGSGNGSGSTGDGGSGTVFVRSSGWFHATDPLLSQDTDTTWSANSGQLMELDKANHISRVGTSAPDTRVARIIWEYDAVSQKPSSWQILLNVSLLDRVTVGFAGLTPAPGDLTIVSVQDRDSAFTDSVIRTVPAPGAAALLALAGLVGVRRRR